MPDFTTCTRNFTWDRVNTHFLKFTVKLTSSKVVSTALRRLRWSNHLLDKITTSCMYVSAYSSCWTKTRFYDRWNVAVALRKWNDMTTKAHCPRCVTKDVRCLQSSLNHICQYPFSKSNRLKNFVGVSLYMRSVALVSSGMSQFLFVNSSICNRHIVLLMNLSQPRKLLGVDIYFQNAQWGLNSIILYLSIHFIFKCLGNSLRFLMFWSGCPVLF